MTACRIWELMCDERKRFVHLGPGKQDNEAQHKDNGIDDVMMKLAVSDSGCRDVQDLIPITKFPYEILCLL